MTWFNLRSEHSDIQPQEQEPLPSPALAADVAKPEQSPGACPTDTPEMGEVDDRADAMRAPRAESSESCFMEDPQVDQHHKGTKGASDGHDSADFESGLGIMNDGQNSSSSVNNLIDANSFL